MPLVKEPHFCQPPLWPWLYRLDTVWQCPRCKEHYQIKRVNVDFSFERRKRWVPLST